MIAELNYPLETLRGNLTKEHYARVQYARWLFNAALNVTSHLLRHKNEPVRPSPRNTQGSIDCFPCLSRYHSDTTCRG